MEGIARTKFVTGFFESLERVVTGIESADRAKLFLFDISS